MKQGSYRVFDDLLVHFDESSHQLANALNTTITDLSLLQAGELYVLVNRQATSVSRAIERLRQMREQF
jgi:hypothetical protein